MTPLILDTKLLYWKERNTIETTAISHHHTSLDTNLFSLNVSKTNKVGIDKGG